MEMKAWHWERMKPEEFVRIILRICIIYIKSKLQSTYVLSMVLKDVTTAEKN